MSTLPPEPEWEDRYLPPKKYPTGKKWQEGDPLPPYPELFKWAYRICKRRGYRIWEIEYRSAINFAVAKAVATWDGKRNPITLVVFCALNECYQTRLMLRKWMKQDVARHIQDIQTEQRTTPIPMSDFEILQFVAVHGRTKAAKLLMIASSDLRDLLEEIEARVKGLLG